MIDWPVSSATTWEEKVFETEQKLVKYQSATKGQLLPVNLPPIDCPE